MTIDGSGGARNGGFGWRRGALAGLIGLLLAGQALAQDGSYQKGTSEHNRPKQKPVCRNCSSYHLRAVTTSNGVQLFLRFDKPLPAVVTYLSFEPQAAAVTTFYAARMRIVTGDGLAVGSNYVGTLRHPAICAGQPPHSKVSSNLLITLAMGPDGGAQQSVGLYDLPC